MGSIQTKLFTSKDLGAKVLIYNIRIIPPEPIFSKVLAVKKEFIELYGEQLLAKSKPHITIAKFKMSALHQNFLIETFTHQLSEHKSFSLKTNGFGGFENSNTLHIRIKESEEFKLLLKKISGLKRALLYHKAKGFGLSHNPHITISSFLDKQILEDSFNHFSNASFKDYSFNVDHLIITSRENGKTWEWKHKIDLKK